MLYYCLQRFRPPVSMVGGRSASVTQPDLHREGIVSFDCKTSSIALRVYITNTNHNRIFRPLLERLRVGVRPQAQTSAPPLPPPNRIVGAYRGTGGSFLARLGPYSEQLIHRQSRVLSIASRLASLALDQLGHAPSPKLWTLRQKT
jgi:hypothetical protein